MVTAVSGFPSSVVLKNLCAFFGRPVAEDAIGSGRRSPLLSGSGRPLRRLSPFEAKVLDLARNVFAHVVVPSFWRSPINFLRDHMVRMGMQEGKVSDGLSKLVARYAEIGSNKQLKKAVQECLGEIAVPKKEVLAVFGEDNSWKDFFVDPEKDELMFKKDITKPGLEIVARITDAGKRTAMWDFYKQSHDVRPLLPWYVSFGFRHLWLFKLAVWQITKRFVIAPTLEAGVKQVKKLAKQGLYATMDLIGESARTQAEADAKFNEYRLFLEKVANGEIHIPNLSASLKLTALTTDLLNEKKREIVAILIGASEETRRALLEYVDGEVWRVAAGENLEERVTDALWGVFKQEPVQKLFGTVGERAALVELLKDVLLDKNDKNRTVFTENGKQLFDACLDMRPERSELAVNLLLGGSKMVELKERVRTLLRLAMKAGARLTIDMEQYRYKDVTFKFYKEILEEEEFQHCGNLEIVVQAYLADAEQDVASLLQWAEKRLEQFGVRTPIRLVKGAYVKSDPEEAIKAGLPRPLCKDQEATAQNFDKVARMLLDKYRCVKVAFASHNPTTVFRVLAYAMEKGIAKEDLEVQMLYGMASSPLLLALAKAGYKVAYYAPIGMKKAIEYLARRMDENKNLKSCLVAIQEFFKGKISLEELLFGKSVAAVA